MTIAEAGMLHDAARHVGALARLIGRKAHDNPFPHQSLCHLAWAAGWSVAADGRTSRMAQGPHGENPPRRLRPLQREDQNEDQHEERRTL